MRFCPRCGNKVEAEDARFCEQCGVELHGAEEAPVETPGDVPEAEEAPTEIVSPDTPASETPTEVIPAEAAAEAHTEVMSSPAADNADAAPTTVMPAPDADEGSPAGGKRDRKKLLLIGGIILVAAAAIAGGVIGYLELTGDSKDAPKAKTVVEVKTVEVDPEADPLEEPFTLKIDTLDGSIPDGLVEMEYLLAEISIEVDDGDVYGMAQRPATAGDGTVIQGAETTLEIKGTYKNGTLKGTWNYYRPYGIADDNGSGEIESAGELTEEEASCLLTGSWFTVYDDGQSDTWDLDLVTIYFNAK
ncbi:MAG: zinc ribbon domain-containing protein [Thermoleophilia bacterium]